MGAKIVADALARNAIFPFEANAANLERARIEIVDNIKKIATAVMGQQFPFEEQISKYFLFTIVALIMDKKRTTICSIGDGSYHLDAGQHSPTEVTDIEICHDEENMPPYVAYDLVGPLEAFPPSSVHFQIHANADTEDVYHAMIATDGVRFFAGREDDEIPGKKKKIGSLVDLCQNEFIFKNKDGLRRKLALLNSSHKKPNWDEKVMKVAKPILRDDTTIVAVRRKPKNDQG